MTIKFAMFIGIGFDWDDEQLTYPCRGRERTWIVVLPLFCIQWKTFKPEIDYKP